MTRELRVLVIMEDTLLEQGIVQRLRENPRLDVRVIGRACDELTSVLAQFRPHVSIMEGGEGLPLEQLLALSPGSAVVQISLDRTGATVYRAEHLDITSIGELVDWLSRAPRLPQSADDSCESVTPSLLATRTRARRE